MGCRAMTVLKYSTLYSTISGNVYVSVVKYVQTAGCYYALALSIHFHSFGFPTFLHPSLWSSALRLTSFCLLLTLSTLVSGISPSLISLLCAPKRPCMVRASPHLSPSSSDDDFLLFSEPSRHRMSQSCPHLSLCSHGCCPHLLFQRKTTMCIGCKGWYHCIPCVGLKNDPEVSSPQR